MNPFGYNLKSRCRNTTKLISNRPVSRNSDTFGYNEHSEVIAKCGGVGGLLAVSIDVMLSFMSFFESPDNEDGPIVEDIENE